MSPSELAALDPIANGLRVVLSDGDEMIDLGVPGGAYDKVGRRGWKVNGAGTSWTYANSSKNPIDAPANGITKISLKTKADGQASF